MAVFLPGEGHRPLEHVAAAGATASGPVDRAALDQALAHLETEVRKIDAELSFRVDEDSGRVIVSVIDTADGTVLLQLPSAEALRIAKYLGEVHHGLISDLV